MIWLVDSAAAITIDDDVMRAMKAQDNERN